jgi:hypothetical protein
VANGEDEIKAGKMKKMCPVSNTKTYSWDMCLVVNCILTFRRDMLPPPSGSVNLTQVDAEVQGKKGMCQLNRKL